MLVSGSNSTAATASGNISVPHRARGRASTRGRGRGARGRAQCGRGRGGASADPIMVESDSSQGEAEALSSSDSHESFGAGTDSIPASEPEDPAQPEPAQPAGSASIPQSLPSQSRRPSYPRSRAAVPLVVEHANAERTSMWSESTIWAGNIAIVRRTDTPVTSMKLIYNSCVFLANLKVLGVFILHTSTSYDIDII